MRVAIHPEYATTGANTLMLIPATQKRHLGSASSYCPPSSLKHARPFLELAPSQFSYRTFLRSARIPIVRRLFRVSAVQHFGEPNGAIPDYRDRGPGCTRVLLQSSDSEGSNPHSRTPRRHWSSGLARLSIPIPAPSLGRLRPQLSQLRLPGSPAESAHLACAVHPSGQPMRAPYPSPFAPRRARHVGQGTSASTSGTGHVGAWKRAGQTRKKLL